MENTPSVKQDSNEKKEWITPSFDIVDSNIAEGLPGDGVDGGAGGDSRS